MQQGTDHPAYTPRESRADAPMASARQPSTALLWIEWLILFIGFPIFAFMEWLPVSKFLVFALPVAYGALVYWRSPDELKVHRRDLGSRNLLIVRLTRAAVIAFLLVALARIFQGAYWFELPRFRFELWLAIMLLYPLVSAFPQEFFYRKFYFWRYGRLFKTLPGRFPTRLLLSNAFVFAFLHIMYDNWVAVALTFAGGALFGYVYWRTGRLSWVWMEHAFYGQVIFSSGLGRFFYEPTPGL